MKKPTDTTWNYRIVKLDGCYGLCEVYYSNGKINYWAEEPELIADTPKELVEILELMLADCDKVMKGVKGILVRKGNKLVTLK